MKSSDEVLPPKPRSSCLSARFSKNFISSQLSKGNSNSEVSEESRQDKRDRLLYSCSGFWIEPFNQQPRSKGFHYGSSSLPIGEWYSEYFVNEDHTNYVSRTATEGDVVISVKREKDTERNTFYRALCRSNYTTTGVIIPIVQLKSGLLRGKAGVLNVSNKKIIIT